ncbi:hypothetical protein BV25DRAFT_1995130 [Artomyces pyxidatus]|uniref:Uncharacterized protein n=1 Tax=Artomyces pyxidatus TaxID=48021 RepID=A0ACB8SKU3_9AGAM|nr:hypothetical protein BV25DRAFT_1995130 [Artomyces pyxidatus]
MNDHMLERMERLEGRLDAMAETRDDLCSRADETDFQLEMARAANADIRRRMERMDQDLKDADAERDNMRVQLMARVEAKQRSKETAKELDAIRFRLAQTDTQQRAADRYVDMHHEDISAILTSIKELTKTFKSIQEAVKTHATHIDRLKGVDDFAKSLDIELREYIKITEDSFTCLEQANISFTGLQGRMAKTEESMSKLKREMLDKEAGWLSTYRLFTQTIQSRIARVETTSKECKAEISAEMHTMEQNLSSQILKLKTKMKAVQDAEGERKNQPPFCSYYRA